MNWPADKTILQVLFSSVSGEESELEKVKGALVKARVKGAASNFDKWRRAGQGRGRSKAGLNIPVSDFPRMLKVFGCEDVDVFLDRCAKVEGRGKPLVIRRKDQRTPAPYQTQKTEGGAGGKNGSFELGGTEIGFREAAREAVKVASWEELAAQKELDGHRTLLERVVLGVSSRTRGGEHPGCEAWLVVKGKVEANFPKRNNENIELGEGDFISFNSEHEHCAYNAGEEVAIMVVARTMGAVEFLKQRATAGL